MLERYQERVTQGEILGAEQVREVVDALVREEIPAESKAAFLTALAKRGESPEEIALFAGELRGRSVQPALNDSLRHAEILDVVGTGGDRLNTFNISSTSALVVSAAGVRVAKHGNRAVTSQSGSADVLDALGIRIELAPDEVGEWLSRYGFAFLFAPKYHPAFRHIAPARKLCAEAGQPTLFNFLGPLLNPVRPSAQIMGVARPDLCEPMARVLQQLGVRRAMVVCGSISASPAAHMDELSTLGPNLLAEYYQDHALSSATLDPALFSVQPATLEDLRGGDRTANAELTRRLLQGEERGPCREAVLLNAGAALFVAGQTTSIGDGWSRAAEVIDSGEATRHLARLVDASR